MYKRFSRKRIIDKVIAPIYIRDIVYTDERLTRPSEPDILVTSPPMGGGSSTGRIGTVVKNQPKKECQCQGCKLARAGQQVRWWY